jgi:hypothetical protein
MRRVVGIVRPSALESEVVRRGGTVVEAEGAVAADSGRAAPVPSWKMSRQVKRLGAVGWVPLFEIFYLDDMERLDVF